MFDTFAGVHVQVFTKSSISEILSSEEGSVQQSLPLTLTGYLIDYDDKFYYLGDTPYEADSVVSVDQVVIIKEIKQIDELDVLMDMKGPPSVN